MIDINSWPLYVQLAFGLGPFVIGFSGGGILVFTTLRHYDRIVSSFPNSRGVQNVLRIFANYGFHPRSMQVAAIAGIVLFPRMCTRRGELEPEEVRNFPPEIKRLMVIFTTLLGVGLAWVALAVVLLKLSGGN